MPISNRKPLLYLAIIIVQLCGSTSLFAQSDLSLNQAINLALQRNLQIKLAIIDEKNGLENLEQAKYSQLPNFSANTQATNNWGRTLDVPTYSYVDQHLLAYGATLNAQFTIFQGGQLKNQILENKILLDVNKSTINKIKNDLTLSVVINYLQILSDQDILNTANEQVRIAKINLGNINEIVKQGRKTIADVDQAQAQITSAELDVAKAENDLETSMLSLKQYMEVSSDTTINLKMPNTAIYDSLKFNVNTTEIYTQALNVNPDVKLALLQKHAAEVNIRLAKGLFYPSIAFIGALNSNYSSADKQLHGYKVVGIDTLGAILGSSILVGGPRYENDYINYPFFKQLSDNFNQYVGISMQIPIFNHFYAHSAVKKARYDDETANVKIDIAKDNLYKIIDQSVLDLKAAVKDYAASQANLHALQEAYNVIFKRYQLNLTNILDLETAEAKFNKAQLDLIQSKYNLIFRRKVIDYYIGKPIVL